MFIRVGMKEAKDYDVIDLDTGKKIRYIQEADDEKGMFKVVVTDKKGNLILDNDKCIITRIKKGNIKLVRKSEEENG